MNGAAGSKRAQPLFLKATHYKKSWCRWTVAPFRGLAKASPWLRRITGALAHIQSRGSGYGPNIPTGTHGQCWKRFINGRQKTLDDAMAPPGDWE